MAHPYIGVSGWRYRNWRGDFYPRGLRQADELAYLGEHLTSAEVNGSFYSLQRPSSYRSWREAVPEGFVFAVKGGRFITHLKQLRGVETALANFFASGVLALGSSLGPLLWQFPARMAFDAALLEEFFALLPRSTAAAGALAARHDEKVPEDRALTTAEADVPLLHAVEPRHASFDSPEARALFARHGICTVLSDSAGTWPAVDADTAGFRYARLHGETALYRGGYAEESLDGWAERVRTWLAAAQDAYVYFDNDADGRAPHDAAALLARLA
ncbi:hypothetical protein GCM10012320_00100 [Sinomonas cellulolyticus]|uniref:DUF72 domain-containing protein n=1 Tax=Sinomonas cellulolyticus TaxID=2801916 RepID=A0ABS1K0S0_9MICC|nr:MULTISPECIES: DUF72 domain-containing protein [Sinomonas]MBL0705130.1 DUF72 domain-containing protein [Sinomonas cellulolyticus]GHG39445.1 hypothetical protein GCM10012320_00100 [Sinomonas sp. KCTC 49339]